MEVFKQEFARGWRSGGDAGVAPGFAASAGAGSGSGWRRVWGGWPGAVMVSGLWLCEGFGGICRASA